MRGFAHIVDKFEDEGFKKGQTREAICGEILVLEQDGSPDYETTCSRCVDVLLAQSREMKNAIVAALNRRFDAMNILSSNYGADFDLFTKWSEEGILMTTEVEEKNNDD